jgi:hypothetical protein
MKKFWSFETAFQSTQQLSKSIRSAAVLVMLRRWRIRIKVDPPGISHHLGGPRWGWFVAEQRAGCHTLSWVYTHCRLERIVCNFGQNYVGADC